MRYYYNRKATADESCRLKISELRKDGMLSSGYSSGTRIWSSNRTDKKTIIGVEVDITDDPYVRLIYSVTDREGKMLTNGNFLQGKSQIPGYWKILD